MRNEPVWVEDSTQVTLQMLQRELARLDEEAAVLTEKAAVVEGKRKSLQTAIDIINYRAAETPPRAPRREASLNPTVSDICEEVIAAAGTPMHVDELIKALKVKGLNVGRKNFRKDLLKSLNRWVQKRSRFERPEPLTYGLAARWERRLA
jgi:hypothetical protein